MRYADRPIFRRSQDVLRRAPFALELARAIDGIEVASDGFVMALNGAWGTGKTSVIELIVRYLRHLEMERASVQPLLGDDEPKILSIAELDRMAEVYDQVELNLKQFDELNRDVTQFERNYRRGLIRNWVASDEDAEEADRYWRVLQLTLGRPRTIVVRFSPWLIGSHAELAQALLGELGRSLGDVLGESIRKSFAELLQRISELAPLASASISLIGGPGGILSAGGEWSAQAAKTLATGKTLDEIRGQLRRQLASLTTSRVLVIVDDLDRLTPLEALKMVSVVKSLGDLPRVIYLLSYDHGRLCELLDTALKSDGGDKFLEKIVQYQVNLPPVRDSDLNRLLDLDLVEILGDLPPSAIRRLSSTWFFVFRHYLRTPRAVKRFVNAIAVAVPALRGRVDLIDLTILELLRVFEPRVYEWVRGNIQRLAD